MVISIDLGALVADALVIRALLLGSTLGLEFVDSSAGLKP